MATSELVIRGELAMENAGGELAKCLPESGFVLFLRGDLGAGKTTFSRGLLRGMGHRGMVKSPTYTLVEEYQLAKRPVYHFDLYRLADPEELEYLGHRDFFKGDALCVLEWPEKGAGFLPKADLEIDIFYDSAESRHLRLQANTVSGDHVVACLQEANGLNSA